MRKRQELHRGKTKAVFATDDPNFVVIENFDALTKFDTPELTTQMKDKAKFATQTTCNVFRLLQAAGVPAAYKEWISETEFLADKCQMIPLEVIIRRYAVGSYLNRVPELKTENGQPPHRFEKLVFEFFLKTTGKKIKAYDGRELGNVPVDDPMIDWSLEESEWELRHPKLPYLEPGSDLGMTVNVPDFIPGGRDVNDVMYAIESIARTAFLVLEGAWWEMNCRLIDFKIEFGIATDGRLLVADVIDNDSWRLRTNDWDELSKQLFRDSVDMGKVSSKYQLVARLSDHLTNKIEEALDYSEKQYEIEEMMF